MISFCMLISRQLSAQQYDVLYAREFSYFLWGMDIIIVDGVRTGKEGTAHSSKMIAQKLEEQLIQASNPFYGAWKDEAVPSGVYFLLC